MNILFLDQFSTIGGGQRSLLELLPALRERGWSARVALPSHGSFSQAIQASGFEVDVIRCGEYTPAKKRPADFIRYGWDFPWTAQGISNLTKRYRIDLLYVNGPRLLPAAALVARSLSTLLLFHSHHRILQPVAVRLAGEAVRRSAASTVACCQFAAEPLREYVGNGHGRVIYNGVAEPSWKAQTPASSSSWTLGVIGRVEPEKGQMAFVEAARILSADLPGCRFLVAGAPLFSGPEYLREVRNASRGLPFEFCGWQDDIGAVFSRLDMLVVPSTDIDSTPRVVLEAFSAGIPVVAFPSGGIPEIVEDNVTGFLASDASPEALAGRIRSVLSMGSRPLREVASCAREKWRAKYTLARYQEEVAEVIAQACS